ncbi:tetratricopeptide repeat protein [Thermogutta sp.]|uniref:tetratricopeptide repeat protein n=1 Tax=Thermogutta sp. TaxID=1962930 RepID=UPI003C7A1509
MRKVNKRFVVILVGVFVLLGVGTYFLHAYQLRRNARVFLDRAQEALKEGRRDVAAKNFQWYTELVPHDLDAQQQFAQLLIDLRAFGPAYFRLETVLRQDPERTEARKMLVDVLLNIGRFRDAEEHLEQYLLKLNPDNAELLTKLAQCQRGLGQSREAVRTLEKALSLQPDLAAAYAQLAGIYRYDSDLKDPRKADECIAKMLATVRNEEALRTAAVYYYQSDQYELALQHAKEILAKKTDDVDFLILGADCARRLEQLDLARDWAEKAIKLDPRRADGYTLLAAILAAQGKANEGMATLQEALSKVSDKATVLASLAEMSINQGDEKSAEKALEELSQTRYPLSRLEWLRARLLLARGQWFEAARKLEVVRPDLTNLPDLLKQVDFYLGLCYAQMGNMDQSLASYSKAATQDPLWPQARLGRAAAFIELGRVDDAIEEYRALVRMGKATSAIILDLCRLLILNNLGRPRTQRDWQEVTQLLSVVEKDPQFRPQAAVLRAEIAVADNQPQEAEKILEQGQKENPDRVEVGLARVALHQHLGQLAEAEKLLQELTVKFGESADILVTRARLAACSGEEQAKKAFRAIATAAEKLSDEDRQRVLSVLVGYSLQFSDFDAARQWCAELSRLAPNNLKVRLLLFDLAIRAQDVASLKPVLDEIARIEGRGPIWHYGEAVRLFLEAKGENREQLRLALDHLARASVLRPNWMRVPALQGQIYDLLGDTSAAINAYSRAISLGDRSILTARRLVQLLYGEQRFLEADKIIRTLEEQQAPFSSDLERLASTVSLRLEDYERALELARRAASTSQDYRDHVWYATVQAVLGLRYRAEGRTADADAAFAEAEKEFRKGVELAPESTDAWVALVQFYARIGDQTKAKETVDEARQKIKGGIAPLAMAQVFEVLGQLDEAEKQYQEALASAPDNPSVIRQVAEFYLRTGRADSARAQLERITSGQVQAPETDVVWGRRSMALLLAAQGGYENLQKGLELIRQNRAAAGQQPSIQDLRAEALLLSAHPQRKKRVEGRELLEKVVNEYSGATPEDRFILAQLYMADGDISNAARHMRTLLASHGNEPRYVRRYVTFLLDQSQTSEAEIWLGQLEKLVPNDMSVVALRARLWTMQGRYEDALKLLEDFANQADERSAEKQPGPSSPESGPEKNIASTTPTEESSSQSLSEEQRLQQVRWALAGDTLEYLASYLSRNNKPDEAKRFVAAAEAIYRRFVDKNPEAAVLLGAFLARHDRVNEALDLLEKNWQSADLALVRAATTVIMGRVYQDRAAADRVEKIVLAAIQKHDRPLSLLLLLGDFYGLQERIPESEQAYREVLKRDPKNIIALNNLAAVLALQKVNVEEAEKLIKTAINIAGPGTNLLDTYAMVLMAQGKPQQAAAVLQEAMEDQPSGILYFHAAQALAQLGKNKEAAEAFQAGVKLGLKKESLHPLERSHFDELARKLGPLMAAS